MAPLVTGCGRRLRGLWPDRNPLRRAGLLASFLIGAPLAALATGQWSYAAALRAEHAQQSAWLLVGPLSRSEMADALLCADVVLALAVDDRAVSPAG